MASQPETLQNQSRTSTQDTAQYQHLIVEAGVRPGVGLIQLNRPKALNALNIPLMEELRTVLAQWDDDPTIRCVVLTGNDRAFAAGADIREMADQTAISMYLRDQFRTWDALRRFRKPLIACVRGYALGGGLELALLCDMIFASESAKFGCPEIKLGIIPGAGATQWLPRLLGKQRAMELILTGEIFSAKDLAQWGILNRVAPDDTILDLTLDVAEKIARQAPIAVLAAKEAIQHAYETFLTEGIQVERKVFFLLFASEDQKEGMQAFLEKRKPQWRGA